MSVVDFGEFEGEEGAVRLVAKLANEGLKKAVVAKEPALSHWWLLENQDGDKLLYAGTPESFRVWHKGQLQ